jgi:hypothetical protein
MATLPVERGKVREYATATAAARTAYLDDPAAPIPPTFLATIVFWEDIGHTVVRAPEVAEVCATVGLSTDVSNLLSLEQEYVFHGPVPRVGDTLYTAERLHDVRVRQSRSGPMVMVRFVVSFSDGNGVVRAECWYTSAYLRKSAP